MYGLSTGTKKGAVVERWRLVEVQLYKIVHISAHAETSEVTIFAVVKCTACKRLCGKF